jgi:serine/threonine protein kinase
MWRLWNGLGFSELSGGEWVRYVLREIKDFRNWKGVSVTIPDNVEVIGDYCFQSCKSLRNVTFRPGSKLKRIGFSVFKRTGLNSIRIPKTVDWIGDSCFQEGASLSEVIFEPDSQLKRMGPFAFSRCGLASIRIPRNVEKMGSRCFTSCISLSEVIFEPESKLTVIEDYVFQETKVSEIEIPNGVEKIGRESFACCRSLIRVTFEAGSKLGEIGPSAFMGTGLKSIQIPSKVEKIGRECFASCGSLSEVMFESDSALMEIDISAFEGTALRSIRIPSQVETIGRECFASCRSLSEVIFESESKLKMLEKNTFERTNLSLVSIPRSVKRIEKSCFHSCKSLREVTFEGAPLIEDRAFSGAPIKHVKVARGVTLNCEFPDDCEIEFDSTGENSGVPHSSQKQKSGSGCLSDLIFDMTGYEFVGTIDGTRVAIWHKRNERIAVKSFPQTLHAKFIRGAGALKVFNHPCVMKPKGICLPQNGEECKLITEYFENGSLKPILASGPSTPSWWTIKVRTNCILGIILGMEYIHAEREGGKLIHRNLKPGNILLDDKYRVRISDFESSRIFQPDVTLSKAGTPLYMAPEAYTGHYDEKVDVYSFGLILYEIIGCDGLFSGSDNAMHLDLHKGWRPDLGDAFDGLSKNLIQRCWSVNPSERPSFSEIWREIQEANFELIPGVQESDVNSYLSWVTMEVKFSTSSENEN